MSFNIRRAPRLALIAAAFAFSQSALAATVTETYSFNLSNFVSTPGSTPSMVTDISATFTVTFDPAVQVIDQAAGITVDSFHAPGSGGVFASLPIVFSFFPNVLPGIDLLSIGGTSPDGETLLPGENDLEFYASFTDP